MSHFDFILVFTLLTFGDHNGTWDAEAVVVQGPLTSSNNSLHSRKVEVNGTDELIRSVSDTPPVLYPSPATIKSYRAFC